MSSFTLALDASTYRGSVAVLDGGTLLAECEVAMRDRDLERLMPAVAEALAEAGASASDVRTVVCGAGPGSFTSLRIAAGIAKGFALGTGSRLVPVPSMLLMVAGAGLEPGHYLAVLDAMRGDRFVAEARVDDSGMVEMAGPTALMPESELAELASHGHSRRVGPDEEIEAYPRARAAGTLASLVEATAAADLSTWEPDYGRLAEAQVRWESHHGRALPAR